MKFAGIYWGIFGLSNKTGLVDDGVVENNAKTIRNQANDSNSKKKLRLELTMIMININKTGKKPAIL
jgi:hypothetical protein